MANDKDLQEKEAHLKTQIKVQDRITASAIASKNARTSKTALLKLRQQINNLEEVAIARLTAKEGKPTYDAEMETW